MNRFQRDVETLINEGFIAGNNGKIRFVFNVKKVRDELGVLGLNERAYNCARRKGYHNCIDILEHWDDLARMKGAGIKTIKEIRNKFLAYYYGELNEEEKKQFWRDTIEATINMGK